MDQRGFAMYFSRASIPYDREGFKTKPVDKIQDCFLRHVGIYGYRAGFIGKYIGCAFLARLAHAIVALLPVPSSLTVS
jgi:3-deoxy-manno-octulosonate cytidylyltransferase (CMP-KDO synthetase)